MEERDVRHGKDFDCPREAEARCSARAEQVKMVEVLVLTTCNSVMRRIATRLHPESSMEYTYRCLDCGVRCNTKRPGMRERFQQRKWDNAASYREYMLDVRDKCRPFNRLQRRGRKGSQGDEIPRICQYCKGCVCVFDTSPCTGRFRDVPSSCWRTSATCFVR
jgi:hypothetical protein